METVVHLNFGGSAGIFIWWFPYRGMSCICHSYSSPVLNTKVSIVADSEI